MTSASESTSLPRFDSSIRMSAGAAGGAAAEGCAAEGKGAGAAADPSFAEIPLLVATILVWQYQLDR